MKRIALLTAAVILVIATAAGSAAAADAAATLEVKGNVGAPATHDMPALEAMPVTAIETSTIWTDGNTKFEGVATKDLLAAADAADGATVRASAADGYSVEIPRAEFEKAIIAYKMDGEPLPLPDFGTFWLIFDYDGDPSVDDEAHYNWSIYQLKSLEVY
jgi:hypothetical protein